MKVKISKNIPPHEWQILLDRLPGYYAFARPEWLAHQVEVSGPRWADETRLYEFSDGTVCLLPLLHRRVGAIPLFIHLESINYSYGGCLSPDAMGDDHLRLVARSLHRANVAKISLFPSPETDAIHRPLVNHGFKRIDTFTHCLALARPHEEIWRASYDDKMRNTIRKAEKHGLHLRASQPDQMAEFIDWYYEMYLETVKRWGTARVGKKDTLISLFHHLQDSAIIFVCFRENQPLSAAIILFGKNNLFYFTNVSHTQFRDLAPNNYLLNEIIRLHSDRWQLFNLGASIGLPQVQKFKESFGAQKIDFSYYVKRRI